MRLSSHEGGGGWPGGVGGLPPGPFGARSMFGDGTYSQNVIQGGSVLQPVGGVLTITGAATVAPDLLTFSCVVLCNTLIVDGAGASLKPSTNTTGLFIIAKTGIYTINGGTISASWLGKAGNFGNCALWSLIPARLQSKLKQAALSAYVLMGEGAAGGPGSTTTGAFGSGSAATLPLQAGGGGSGGTYGATQGGNGGKGGPCCGGGGGGGNGYPSGAGGNAPDYGPGGNARTGQQSNCNNAGGAGDPIGTKEAPQCGSVSDAPGAGGAPLFLLSPIVSVASGTVVQSDGSRGGDCVGIGGGYSQGGGGAGGGIVGIVTRPGGYTNNGTVRANGGAGGNVTGASGNHCGGPGGAGSVNIFTAA